MIFDRNEKKQMVALLGAGSMGTAIVRRIAAGKKILLGDISEKALERVGDDFRRSSYDVETCVVNALELESIETFAQRAASLGPVMYFIDTAGASPNQASPEHIVALDMVGTGYAVDAFGRVMAEGGAGLIILSQAAYMYPIPNEDELQIVNAATDELAALPIVRDVAMQNSGLAYMIAKRVNHLLAQRAAATAWIRATRLPMPPRSSLANTPPSSTAPTCSSTAVSSPPSARGCSNYKDKSVHK